MLWPSLENAIRPRTSYSESRELPAVEPNHLTMELAKKKKKCQFSKNASSLAPPNFRSHLTTEPFSYEILQRQVTLQPTFKYSNPEIIHIRCDLKMKSFPSPSSGLLYQLFSLLSTLFPQIFTRMTSSPFGAQFNQHILGENFPDYPS